MRRGTCLSVSIHVELIVTNSPFELILFNTCSSLLNSYLFFFRLNWKLRTIKTSLFLGVKNFNLILAFVSVFPVIFGSFMNVFPFEERGGSDPAVAILRHSIIV